MKATEAPEVVTKIKKQVSRYKRSEAGKSIGNFTCLCCHLFFIF
ncbi:hypothetical protein [Litoribacterium kuwaitense]|nr:hypothetical protein [Litoribacterium kuwaitense]